MVKKYNVSKPEQYIKDGVEKTYWANVGTMTEFKKQDGSISRLLEIPAIGLKANIFPIEPKQNTPQAPQTHTRAAKKEAEIQLNEEYPDEEDINQDDIPF